MPHVEGGLNSELYAVPVKRRQPKEQKNNAILQNNAQEKPSDVDSTDSEDKDENLPPGWQKHEGRYQQSLRQIAKKDLFQVIETIASVLFHYFVSCINRENFFDVFLD